MTKTDDLINITRDIVAAIQQFKGLLTEEAEALSQTDKTGLMEIAERKIRYADHLDNLVRQRAKALQGLGIAPNDSQSLDKLIAENERLKTVNRDWVSALHTLKECQIMNKQAGADIQLQSQYFRRGIELLSGQPLHTTYGANGNLNDASTFKELGTA